ncbi:MAG: DUF1566 domain-containing protein [Sulfurimonas sp.]|nr:DUF1566 domain-containing protein [Sulfurimonas sp.]
MKVILLIMIGLSMLNAEYLRDNTKEVVLDTTTNLMWQDNTTPATTMTWANAITYCEGLTLGTYPDWRLPNLVELASLVDDTRENPAMSTVFQNTISQGYWSSTTSVASISDAWYIGFDDGHQFNYLKTYNYYVRCARAGQ